MYFMKKRIIFVALFVVLLVCMAIPGHSINQNLDEQRTEPNRVFIFTPPFGNSMQYSFDDAVPSNYNPLAPGERLDAFLKENEELADDPSYIQDTNLVLIDSDQHDSGNLVLASNIVNTGTTTNVYKPFTYLSGYGPSSSIAVKIAGYPVNYYFTAYGIAFYWFY